MILFFPKHRINRHKLKAISHAILKSRDGETFINGMIAETITLTTLSAILMITHYIATAIDFGFSTIFVLGILQVFTANRFGKQIYKFLVNFTEKNNFTQEDFGSSIACGLALIFFHALFISISLNNELFKAHDLITLCSIFITVGFVGGPTNLRLAKSLEEKDSDNAPRSDIVILSIKKHIAYTAIFIVSGMILHWIYTTFALDLIIS